MSGYLKIGAYEPARDGRPAVINKAWYRQGFVVKDAEAFLNHPDEVCYIPELAEDKSEYWTGRQILEECGGNKTLADELFRELDWASPSAVLDEWKEMGDIAVCRSCGYPFDWFKENRRCPACGCMADIEE